MRGLAEESVALIRQQMIVPELRPSANPTVFAMAGIPAAGKSTFVLAAQDRGDFPKAAFLFNPDSVMTALPEYQQAVRQEGLASAFTQWEMPARALSQKLFEEAASRRFDIIKDMACAREENFEMLAGLKESGYKIKIFYIAIDPAMALQRSKTRSSRHTPDVLIHERQAALQNLLPRYRVLADEFHTFDNNDSEEPYRRLD
ncbi:MAG: zeta toxin family protein [Pseudomonadales bacterium]|nr:zeta toxin family protein [Pseudomonadales bacterium]